MHIDGLALILAGSGGRHRFRKGDRVRHLVTTELGTVIRDWDGVGYVRVQFDVDFDEDGVGWPWTTEPDKLERVQARPIGATTT